MKLIKISVNVQGYRRIAIRFPDLVCLALELYLSNGNFNLKGSRFFVKTVFVLWTSPEIHIYLK